jgi:uncharacterized protein (TIGR04255 family)
VLYLPRETALPNHESKGTQGRQYRHPPIEEALCEFHYASGPEEEFGWPLKFYERIKDVYSGKPREQQISQAGFQVTQQPGWSHLAVKQFPYKTLFPTQDERELVGIGSDVLSIHVVRPYPGWNHFRQRIEKVRLEFEDVVRPTGIRQIALRYINRVVLPEISFDLSKYFTFYPAITDMPPGKMVSFFIRTQSLYDDKPIRLTCTFTDLGVKTSGQTAFILDFELVQEWVSEPLALHEVMVQVDELRVRERAAFEDLITDQTREVFNAD